MFRFLQQNITAVPAQDVEMGIGNVAEPSTSHSPILSPIPPQNEEMVLDPKDTPEILMFMEKQRRTIDACTAQVSHYDHIVTKTQQTNI